MLSTPSMLLSVSPVFIYSLIDGNEWDEVLAKFPWLHSTRVLISQIKYW